MLKARKGNKVVRIPDNKMDTYKALGYSVYTMDGETLYEPMSGQEQLKKLQEEYDELLKKFENLKAETDGAGEKPTEKLTEKKTTRRKSVDTE